MSVPCLSTLNHYREDVIDRANAKRAARKVYEILRRCSPDPLDFLVGTTNARKQLIVKRREALSKPTAVVGQPRPTLRPALFLADALRTRTAASNISSLAGPSVTEGALIALPTALPRSTGTALPICKYC